MPSSATRSGTPATKRRSFGSLSSKLPKSLRSMEKYDETEQSPGGFASAEAEKRTWDKSPFTQQGKVDATNRRSGVGCLHRRRTSGRVPHDDGGASSVAVPCEDPRRRH